MAIARFRAGGREDVDENNFDNIVKLLINNLRTEEFEEPDDEHTQVSIANDHWGVTAQVSGLISFDNMNRLFGRESDLPREMFQRDIPDAELKKIWLSVVKINQVHLLESDWVQFEQLPAYTADYYRK